MAQNQEIVDLTTKTNQETLDLTLRLSVMDGKKPIKKSLKSNKRKRAESEENVSTGRSSEGRLAQLELQVHKLEELLHHYSHDLGRKIDLHFNYAAQIIYAHQSSTNECLKKLHTLLQQLTQSINPDTSPSSRTPPFSFAPSSSRTPHFSFAPSSSITPPFSFAPSTSKNPPKP